MHERLKALREKRGKIAAEMRSITDLAEKEKRDLRDEESAKHAELFGEQDKLKGQIVVLERQLEVERETAAAADESARNERSAGGERLTVEQRQMLGFRSYLRTGQVTGDGAEEFRALQAGANTEGGFTVAPQQFVGELIQGLDNMVHIRAAARKFTVTTAESLGAPSLDADIDDFEWTTELQTGSEDNATRFGKREFRPYPMAKRIKVSKALLRRSALPIESIIRQRMEYKLGVTQEKAYLTGNGDRRPLGVYVASNDGIPTSRDVSTGNTGTSITFDGLISAKYSLKSGYWARARWNFHRDAILQISKLKDGEGRYLWRESVREGEPDRILNLPVDVSEYAPNTFTTGQYVGLLGDFQYYWIVDCLDFQVQRLVELYAESNQDGFIGRYEGDGMPVLAEAFARVKLG